VQGETKRWLEGGSRIRVHVANVRIPGSLLYCLEGHGSGGKGRRKERNGPEGKEVIGKGKGRSNTSNDAQHVAAGSADDQSGFNRNWAKKNRWKERRKYKKKIQRKEAETKKKLPW